MKHKTLRESGMELLKGTVSLDSPKLDRMSISSTDMPRALWRMFGGVARLNGLSIAQALQQAVLEWIQRNGRKQNEP